jgi:hypothetical protein
MREEAGLFQGISLLGADSVPEYTAPLYLNDPHFNLDIILLNPSE